MFQELLANIDIVLFVDFLLRLALNMTTVFILIRYIFYPYNFQTEYFFTYPQMGLIIFLVASVLNQIDLEIALAMGLFAVFSILRYRSVALEPKEMTYLFTVIGISIINAMVDFEFHNWLGLLTSNFVILGSAYIAENYKPRKVRNKKLLTFHPSSFEILNDRELLLNEIREHSQINVTKVEIFKINITKNEVTVWIYFRN